MSIQEDLKTKGPEYFLKLKNENGKVFWLDGYLFAFDPKYVNQIYVKQYDNFIKAGGWHKMRTNEEPQHFLHRRILNPAFHVNKINLHIEKMTNIISKEIEFLPDTKDFLISDYFLDLSYKVLTNTLFNDKDLSTSKEFKNIFYSIMEQVGKGEKDGLGTLSQDRDKLYSLVSEIVFKRIENKENHNDFLDLLIESLSQDEMSIQDIVDETISMLLAGHETTASIVVWAILHSSAEQNILNKVQSEAKEFNSKKIKNGILDTLKNLKYSEYVVNEALRLYPPVWYSPRQAVEDCQIEETFLPKGTKVIVSSYVSHRDEDYFKDPFKFIPERWDDGFENSLPIGTYFPFHIGQRKCIGYKFGMIQAQITLLEFFNSFEITSDYNISEGVPLATYRPKQETCVSIRRISL
jgi:cytochrome P450